MPEAFQSYRENFDIFTLRYVIQDSMGEIKKRSKHTGYLRTFITKEMKMKRKTAFGKRNSILW